MGLESAMYTGLSGLSVNQQQLTVVGNNIANANTTAFKSSRVLFTTEAYITQDPGSPATSNFGGSNPSQLGLGATIGSIEKDFTGGSIQNTGNEFDMAINGNGFFVVKNQDGQQFTRNGAFDLNANNELVTADGSFVQGYGVDSNYKINSTLGNVTIPLNSLTTAQQTQNVSYTGILNSGGQIADGASILDTQDLTTLGGATTPTAATLLTNVSSASSNLTPLFNTGDVLTLNGNRDNTNILPPLNFTITAGSTVQDLEDFFSQGMQIDTAVTPPAGAPTPGVGLIAGGAANSIQLSITGNTGADNALSLGPNALISTNAGNDKPLAFTADAASNPIGESATVGPSTFYDSLGNPIRVSLTASFQGVNAAGGTLWQFIATSPDVPGAATFTPGSPNSAAVIGQGTLTFDANGSLVASTGTALNIDRTGTGAASPMTVNLDFSQLNSLNTSQSANGAASSIRLGLNDGAAEGTLQSFTVSENGVISGVFSNGIKRDLGQIALATFSNQQGLISQSDNKYSAGSDSGPPTIAAPGSPGVGTITGDSLEQSNVDLSTEFVNLIIASTGFSAASRVITTSDQLVQDLLNSTR